MYFDEFLKLPFVANFDCQIHISDVCRYINFRYMKLFILDMLYSSGFACIWDTWTLSLPFSSPARLSYLTLFSPFLSHLLLAYLLPHSLLYLSQSSLSLCICISKYIWCLRYVYLVWFTCIDTPRLSVSRFCSPYAFIFLSVFNNIKKYVSRCYATTDLLKINKYTILLIWCKLQIIN